MIQRKLSDLELGEVLGVGTVGTIYKAIDKRSGLPVAVKILLPAVMSDPIVVPRFEREMFILEKLSHPNIVAYFGGGKNDNQLFYVMELVEGATLKEILADCGKLTWQETITVARQVASALQHAHNHGIIHRDLKPANLFLTKDGRVKLGDFGIARDLGMADITTSGLTVGTNAYMSPEQITGDRRISGKTDLYALGCVMFEMLAGRPPFEGANFAQLFEQHLRTPPPGVRQFNADCPPELEALILRLLEKDPEKRPFNARAVQGLIMQLLENQPQQEVDSKLKHHAVEAMEHEHDRAHPGDRGADEVSPDDFGRGRLANRITRLEEQAQNREISWWKVGGLALVVLIVVAIAWACNGP